MVRDRRTIVELGSIVTMMILLLVTVNFNGFNVTTVEPVMGIEAKASTEVPTAGITKHVSSILQDVRYSSGPVNAGVSAEISKALKVSVSKNKVEKVKEAAEEIEEAEVATEEIKGFPQYANEEYLLAILIELEAGKTREDRIYTGSVAINRARTRYKDFRSVNSIEEVFYQKYPRQYADETLIKIADCEPSEEALEVARGLISGEIPCLEESTLFQTSTWKTWMAGRVEEVALPGACQFYGRPLDFEEGCQ